MGVADGVGGWSDRGVDPALFSRALTRGAEKAALAGERDSFKLVQAATEATPGIAGSSTLCVVSLNHEQKLEAANVGDSAFLVIRDDSILFRSEEQQHSFNFPFQLAATRGYGDPVESAQRYKLDIKVNDIVILGNRIEND